MENYHIHLGVLTFFITYQFANLYWFTLVLTFPTGINASHFTLLPTTQRNTAFLLVVRTLKYFGKIRQVKLFSSCRKKQKYRGKAIGIN